MALLLLAPLALCCGRAKAPRTPPPPPLEVAPVAPPRAPIPLPASGTVTIDGRSVGPRFAVEVALTELERNQGLMYRKTLGSGRGMVFFMPGVRDWAFYMRNTLIPLDMIFIDASWRVVGVVARAQPLTETLRRVGAPSTIVLELDGGEAARHGIRAGTQLRYSGPRPAGWGGAP